MPRKKRNEQINKIVWIGISLVLVLVIFIEPVFCQSSISDDMDQLERVLDQSKYSGFQKRMISDTTKDLLNLGVNAGEIEKLLKTSINNHFDAYNVKKIFEVLIKAKEDDLSENSLLNKIKEGLAKRVDERLIITALENEVNHLRVAKRLLQEQQFEESSFNEEMLEVLVESLNNGVPAETLTEIITKSTAQGKNPEEIADISTELGNLSLRAYELGFSDEEVVNVFQKVVQNRSEVEGICEDIQDILIGAAAAKMKMSSGKSTSESEQQTSLSGVTTEDGDIASGTPDISTSIDDSAGSSPTVADDKPDMETKPDDDTSSSPPEN